MRTFPTCAALTLLALVPAGGCISVTCETVTLALTDSATGMPVPEALVLVRTWDYSGGWSDAAPAGRGRSRYHFGAPVIHRPGQKLKSLTSWFVVLHPIHIMWPAIWVSTTDTEGYLVIASGYEPLYVTAGRAEEADRRREPILLVPATQPCLKAIANILPSASLNQHGTR